MNDDLPESAPGPIRVMIVDLEQPLPEISREDRYSAAMVVGRHEGIPIGAVEVDLRASQSVRQQLAPLYEALAATTPSDANGANSVALPSISVVIPTIVARTEDLTLLLDGLKAVDYPDAEFILVDNRPKVPDPDPLSALMENRPGFRVIPERRPGISAARNAGVAAARGSIVAFTDDDVRVDTQWLRAIGHRFATEPDLDAVTGLILPAELETPAQIWFERYYGGFSGERTFAPLTLAAVEGGPRTLHGSRVSVRNAAGEELRRFAVYGAGAYGAGANMAFRRSVLERLGGFDLALGTGTPARGGEDLATMISVLWSGGKVGYEPAAVVHHRHRREVPELLHQLRGNGLGFAAMLTSLISHDRRHVLGILSQLPLAARQMMKQIIVRIRANGGHRPAETDQAGSRYPRELVLNELRGYPRGPVAYVRSRRAAAAFRY